MFPALIKLFDPTGVSAVIDISEEVANHIKAWAETDPVPTLGSNGSGGDIDYWTRGSESDDELNSDVMLR